MGTIAEDMERVRELYRSIKTPWKRPHFPEPPAEFLPPEKFLELAKEAVLGGKSSDSLAPAESRSRGVR